MNENTVNFAKMLIKHAEKVAGVECKMTPRLVIMKLQKVLNAQCADPMYDIDDALADVYVNFCIYKRVRAFTTVLTEVLNDKGLNYKDADGNFKPSRPEMEELWGTSNDDDLQGDEILSNNMEQIVSTDVGPGSDAHIACMDVETVFNEDHRTILECTLAGEQELPVADLTGLSRDQVKRRKRSIEEYLAKHEYTLAPVNTRLGTVMYFMGQRYSFPADKRKQERIAKEGGHNVNTWTDHRSTKYTDKSAPDFSKPLAPTGDGIANDGLGYETNIGVDTLHADDQANAKPDVATVSWADFPNGVDTRPQFSQYGNPANWTPRKDSDESIQRMCNEIFATYKGA